MEIKKISIVFIFFKVVFGSTILYSQNDTEFIMRTQHSLTDTLLIDQIRNFINTHTYKLKKKGNALFVDIEAKRNETQYTIYTEPEFYYGLSGNRVQYIAELDGVLILIGMRHIKQVSIERALFLQIIKERCPDIYTEYMKNGYFPLLSTHHNLPHWSITVRDDKVVDKKVFFN